MSEQKIQEYFQIQGTHTAGFFFFFHLLLFQSHTFPLEFLTEEITALWAFVHPWRGLGNSAITNSQSKLIWAMKEPDWCSYCHHRAQNNHFLGKCNWIYGSLWMLFWFHWASDFNSHHKYKSRVYIQKERSWQHFNRRFSLCMSLMRGKNVKSTENFHLFYVVLYTKAQTDKKCPQTVLFN